MFAVRSELDDIRVMQQCDV